jgi:ParB family transcriptional regulator, chromosome partitioning protein
MQIEEVEPAACRMWSMHERLGEEVTAKSCASLIESVKSHGIKQPVLGRRIVPEGRCEIELIYGARRLFAAQQLGMRIPVQLSDLDDRAALIEMDIENRERRDISPYERGVSYRRWLAAGMFGSQAELAKSLRISGAQVSRLLRFSELPAVVVSAFESVEEIREEWAVELAKRCRNDKTRETILRRARAQGGSLRPPLTVYRALVEDGRQGSGRSNDRDEVVKDAAGRPLLRIGFRSKSIHFIIPRDRIRNEDLQRIAEQLHGILVSSEQRVDGRANVGGTGLSRSRPTLNVAAP